MAKQLVRCGCGKHFAPQEQVVQFQGKLWSTFCAFNKAVQTIKSKDTELKRLRHIVRTAKCIPCGLCEKPVGTKPNLFGSAVYCVRCVNDIGGEG